MKKVAFTLAEVLITLGIIGVVAAITIPTIIQNQQKRKIENILKQDYSIIQQVMRFTESDEVSTDFDIPDTLAGAKNWFNMLIAPHLKYSKVCYDKAGCWQAKSPTRNLNRTSIPYNRTGIGVGANIITVRLVNGSNLCIDGFDVNDMKRYFGTNTKSSSLVIYIDANGDSGPNIVGKDIYILVWTSGGLFPAGIHETTDTINKNCSKDANGTNAGFFCLERVKNNGWVIPTDVWKIKN